jgi:hypothetical protein
MMNAVRAGTVLALTVAFAYAVCALVFWLWPDAALQFMNGLFHDLDFRKLREGAGQFAFASFAVSLAGIAVWAFLVGGVYGWLSNRFAVRG